MASNTGDVVTNGVFVVVPPKSSKISLILNGLSPAYPVGVGTSEYGDAKMLALMPPGGFEASPSDASNMFARMSEIGSETRRLAPERDALEDFFRLLISTPPR